MPLQIKKHESVNYSEMISGELDSLAKSELEAVKKIIREKMTNTSEDINNLYLPIKKIIQFGTKFKIYTIGF